MADLKISQLTGATTPLAGSEVLPIVQSGTTKKVATDNLTVQNVRSNASTGILQIAGPAAGTTRTMTTPNANFTAARTDAAQSFTGDQTLSTGNLVQGTAAKGVNFTANTPAAGMTSQLLNWYEEGTWTPALTFGGAAVGLTGTLTGTYTRIGNTVNVWGKIVLTNKGSSTGNALITGLPFAKGADPAASSNVIDPITGMANLTANGCMFSVISGSAIYPMVQTATSRVQITDQYFTNSSQIIFSSTYKV